MENVILRFDCVYNGSLREGIVIGEDRYDINRVSCWFNMFSENLLKFIVVVK